MKKLLVFLITAWVAIWLGLKMAADPGYILMAYGTWTVEMPLWLGILLIIALVAILFLLFDLIRCSFGIPERFRFWSAKRMVKWSQKQTQSGLVALAEGYWKDAEKHLSKAAKESPVPLIHYLASAYAAQAQGSEERRDAYLKQAHETNPDATIAIGLTQAHLQMSNGQYEQALATLRHLRDLVPKHQHVLLLLKKVYLKLQDWNELEKLFPLLKKYRILPPDELVNLEKQIYVELLTSEKQNVNIDSSIWSSLPSHLKNDPELLALYAEHLIELKKLTEAEHLIRRFLKKQCNAKLVLLYGSFQSEDIQKQAALLASLAKQYPNQAEIFYSLAQFYQAQQLWGKAKSALETAVQLKPEKQYLFDLALFNEKHKNVGAALSLYRQAATASTGT